MLTRKGVRKGEIGKGKMKRKIEYVDDLNGKSRCKVGKRPKQEYKETQIFDKTLFQSIQCSFRVFN